MNPYLEILGKKFPYYGILFTLGLLIGGVVIAINCSKRKISKLDAVYASCFASIGGIVGAKLLSILTSIEIIIQYKLSFVDVISNGFVFYGGLIGGFLGLILYCKIYKLNYGNFLDVFAVSVPLGHAIGRVGCFISGCCFGIPCQGALCYTYTQSVDINTPIGVSLLPVQLIEAFFLIVMFVALEIVYLKCEKKGVCTYIYIYGYAVFRFIIEFFRGDFARGFLLGLSTSQLISILIVLITAGFQIYTFYKAKNKQIKKSDE